LPGMSLLCGTSGRPPVSTQSLRQALERVYQANGWTIGILMDTAHCVLGSASPLCYPIWSCETDSLSIHLEGHIYGESKEGMGRALAVLGERLTGAWTDCKDVLRPWILKTDGQFVCVVRHKTSGRVMLFNDVFGRLPLYYHLCGGQAVFSRDLKLVWEIAGCHEFDRQAVWEYLLFLYCLDYGTLLSGVKRLPAAGAVLIDQQEGIRVEALHTFDLEHKQHKGESLETNADRLVELLTESCRRRAALEGTTVLSLSGGLDSRAIAGALRRGGVSFEATSWLDAGKRVQADVDVARRVAESLGIQHHVHELRPATGAAVVELLKIKNGQVNLGIPHALQYFREVRDKYGCGLTYLSGNGGDKAMPDLRSRTRLRTLDELVGHILRRNQLFSTELLGRLVGVDEDEILWRIRRLVASFPEEDLRAKYVHFVVCQRGFMRFVEGDERQRFFFEVGAPFWSPEFFFYAMNCPDEQKHGSRLYAQVLQKLHCGLADIERVVEGRCVPIIAADRPFVRLSERMRRWPNPIRFAGKTLRRKGKPSAIATGYMHSGAVLDCLKTQSRTCGAIGEYFCLDTLDSIIERSSSYGREAISALLTVCSTIEWLVENRSTLDKYAEVMMDPFV